MGITKSKLQIAMYLIFVVLILSLPVFLNVFWLNRIATYLVYGMAAVGISMAWGYGGVLNLGQGAFFGLGAYMLAMSLTLANPELQGVPQFMLLNAAPGTSADLCCITAASFLWIPFKSQWIGVMLGILLPVIFAYGIGYAMFRRRTTGVYVAIIMLAFVLILQLLIVNNLPLTNGFNGLAELGKFKIGSYEFDPYSSQTYLLVATLLSIVLFTGRWLLNSRAGLILRAIQDNESRCRFFGYDVAMFKLFFLCISTGIAGLAGMLFVLVSSFASPSLMAIPFSISMVIWAAVGGRGSLLGACAGAILVNLVEGLASESPALQPVWPLILGGMFVGFVLFLPAGIAGLLDKVANRITQGSRKRSLIVKSIPISEMKLDATKSQATTN